MLRVKVFMLILYSIATKFHVKKNQHKYITRTICKTEYKDNNSSFCRYDENKTNSATKLGTVGFSVFKVKQSHLI